ncbi:MAG TPA: hypothetical protein GXZ75_10990 [Clostridia bacterium]|jgi:hypothetical protein|nr:hypothetical protein [Clostridia bacterium]
MFDLMLLIVAFCGGVFGAAIGILPSFICVGLVGLPGIAAGIAGSTFNWHGLLTFGPFFGPQISFVAAVAAASYARKKGYLGSGKDAVVCLMGLNKPDVLLVGGIFGALGYIVHSGICVVAGQGQTDTVALTVVILGLVAKVVFGKHGLREIFGVLSDEAKARGRFKLGGSNVWLPFQSTMGQKVAIALGVGGLSAYVTQVMLAGDAAIASQAIFVGFCISAASLIFLQVGQGIPITHHLTITAAYAVAASGNIFWGIAMAIIASQLADIGSRLFLIHGDTHVDPPACAICSGAFLVYLLNVGGIFKVGGNFLPLLIIAVFVVWGVFDFKQEKLQQGVGVQG